MKTILEKYSEDIKYGLGLAGYGELYLPFIEQIETVSFEEKQLPIGDTLMWMLFRARGEIKVVENIEWAEKAPLPIFSFTVVKGSIFVEGRFLADTKLMVGFRLIL